MKTANEKKCPGCENGDIVDTGTRMGDAVNLDRTREIPEPTYPIYECKKCGERFFYLGN